ncbi:MAG: glutamyl/glutaminyl-tRNA synthetase [Candidatus Peribacteria bacterium]|nr:glutamyl/glutaminyl-tRNA synthetase [Candidatus Peribacteria bacterium]
MRTRFAPSPTGYLHVGGLRTALYAYLLARQTKDNFILRIEDTDQGRSVDGAVEQIVHGLAWAGIAPDEGVVLENGEVAQTGDKGPYIQSERLELYKKYADQLLHDGFAYTCFCSPARLDEMRKQQQADHRAPMYDRHCLSLDPEDIADRIAAGDKYVIRMKVPHDELIEFTDVVRGEMSFRGDTIDDQVLLKSDGFPTYHLAHVVDDHLMGVDMITRSEEWLPSTPKHLLLFQAFGWPAPTYAHFPLILNKDRTKLSKRRNSVSVNGYREKGYLPEALINFLALLGWNPGTTQELFTLEELIEQFSMERVQKAGAIFDTEKLDWLQGQWMRKFSLSEFASRIRELVGEQYPAALADTEFEKKAALIQERITFFHEAPDMMSFFYTEPAVRMDVIANPKQKVTADILPDVVNILIETLGSIHEPDWNLESISSSLIAAIDASGLKKGQVLWPLRAILTGREYSPGAFEVAEVLGKETTLKRLKGVFA